MTTSPQTTAGPPADRSLAAPTPAGASSGRLFAPLSVAELLRLSAWACLLTSCVVLADPVAVSLFAPDGERLGTELARTTTLLRNASGVAGLALLAAAASRRASRRLSVRRGHLAILPLAVLFAALLGEVALRVRGLRNWGSALRTPLAIWDARPKEAPYFRPGRYTAVVTSDFSDERRLVVFEINRLGLRGRVPALPKAAATTRILCVGGSSTFGLGVSEGEDWPARLHALLSARGVEVLNAGRPGSTTWSDFQYLRDRLLRLEPDVVVLYEGFNDLWRGVRRHSGEQSDYGVVAAGLPAVPGELDLGPLRTWPLRASFIAYQGAGLLKRAGEERRRAAASTARGSHFEFHPGILAVYETNLREIVRLCRARGVRPVLATFAGCDRPEAPEAERRRRLNYVLTQMPALDVEKAEQGLDLYREITRRVAREEAVLLVDLAASMTKDLIAYADTIHFSPRGEAALASLLAPALDPVLPRDSGR